MMITVYLVKEAPVTCKLQKNTSVDGTEWVYTIWPMRLCPKAGVNLFSLTCELLQGKILSSDHQNNIVVKCTDGDIIIDCQIKSHDSWVARVKFLVEISDERVQSVTAPCKKTINNLHGELGHPFK